VANDELDRNQHHRLPTATAGTRRCKCQALLSALLRAAPNSQAQNSRVTASIARYRTQTVLCSESNRPVLSASHTILNKTARRERDHVRLAPHPSLALLPLLPLVSESGLLGGFGWQPELPHSFARQQVGCSSRKPRVLRLARVAEHRHAVVPVDSCPVLSQTCIGGFPQPAHQHAATH